LKKNQKKSLKSNNPKKNPNPLPENLRKVSEIKNDKNFIAASDFNIGDKVVHQKFGSGEIVRFEDQGSNKKAIIQFDNGEIKKLLLKFAKLSKKNS